MKPECSISTAGIDQLIKELNDALIGYGVEADLPKLMKHQAGLLAMEISNQLGPKTKAAGAAKLEVEIYKTFAEITPPMFTGTQSGKGEIQWMFGVEKHNYLVGAHRNDMQLSIGAVEMGKFERGRRGVKWFVDSRSIFGKHQRRIILQRTIVARGRMRQLLSRLTKRVGRMRSVFAYAASMCGQTRIPDWVKTHFSAVSSEGRAVFDDSKLTDKESPQIAFGGSAPGLLRFAPMIQDAIETRAMKTADRIARIIRSYSEQHAQGRSITRQADSFSE